MEDRQRAGRRHASGWCQVSRHGLRFELCIAVASSREDRPPDDISDLGRDPRAHRRRQSGHQPIDRSGDLRPDLGLDLADEPSDAGEPPSDMPRARMVSTAASIISASVGSFGGADGSGWGFGFRRASSIRRRFASASAGPPEMPGIGVSSPASSPSIPGLRFASATSAGSTSTRSSRHPSRSRSRRTRRADPSSPGGGPPPSHRTAPALHRPTFAARP